MVGVFTRHDPYGSGSIAPDRFVSVLRKLQPGVSDALVVAQAGCIFGDWEGPMPFNALVDRILGQQDKATSAGAWTVEAWVQSLGLHGVIAQALGVPRLECELDYVKSLGKPRIADLLRSARLEGLLEPLWTGLQELRAREAPSGADLNSKFAVEANLKLELGSLDTAHTGLTGLIGLPCVVKGSVVEAMRREHCEGPDKAERFPSSDGMVTHACEEWEFVNSPQCGKIYSERNAFRKLRVAGLQRRASLNGLYVEVFDVDQRSARFKKEVGDGAHIFWSDDAWHCGSNCFVAAAHATKGGEDSKNALVAATAWTMHAPGHDGPVTLSFEEVQPEKCRRAQELQTFVRLLEPHSRQLKDIGHLPVSEAELIAARLYTGPMCEKYNAQLRGASSSEFLKKRCDELLKGNSYATTIHAISSFITKLSKVMKVGTVYRGLQCAELPASFWTPKDAGVCGATEFGFSSATRERKQALCCADGAVTVFELKQGVGDRGADVSWLSQYGYEQEVVFPPLSGLQALSSKVRGTTFVVEARLSPNLPPETLEQVLAGRQEVLSDTCGSFDKEIQLVLAGPAWKSLLEKPFLCQVPECGQEVLAVDDLSADGVRIARGQRGFVTGSHKDKGLSIEFISSVTRMNVLKDHACKVQVCEALADAADVHGAGRSEADSPCRAGQRVRAVEDLDDAAGAAGATGAAVKVSRGQRGEVVEVDQEGNLTVEFVHTSPCWIPEAHLNKVQPLELVNDIEEFTCLRRAAEQAAAEKGRNFKELLTSVVRSRAQARLNALSSCEQHACNSDDSFSSCIKDAVEVVAGVRWLQASVLREAAAGFSGTLRNAVLKLHDHLKEDEYVEKKISMAFSKTMVPSHALWLLDVLGLVAKDGNIIPSDAKQYVDSFGACHETFLALWSDQAKEILDEGFRLSALNGQYNIIQAFEDMQHKWHPFQPGRDFAQVEVTLVRNLTEQEVLYRVDGLLGAATEAECEAAGHRLARLLALNPTCTKLDFGSCRLAPQAAAVLATGLESNSTVLTLSLPEVDLGEEGGMALAEALRTAKVQVLNLSRARLPPPCARALLEALRETPDLRELWLNEVALDEAAGQAAAELLRASRSLELLFLRDAGLSERAAVALAGALGASRSIRAFAMGGRWPPAAGERVGAALAAALQKNTSLESMDVEGIPEGSSSWAAIEAAVHNVHFW